VIRQAQLTDLPALVQLGATLHAESPRYSRLRFSWRKVEQTLELMILNPAAAVLVAEEQGTIVGAALAVISEEWFSDELVAQEMSVFIAPERRGALTAARLIASLDEWAQRQGARYLQAGSTTGVDMDRTIDLYERLGFTRVAIGVERAYQQG
jgi:GNAT superfamily N-acetyltransferase